MGKMQKNGFDMPGDNLRFTGHKMELMALGGKPDMTNPEAVKKRIVDYFEITAKYDLKPSIESLALAFGVSRTQYYYWAHDQRCDGFPGETIDLIKQSYAVINSLMADYMQNGKIHPVAGIFLMKNSYDYVDTRETIVKPADPLKEVSTPEELQQKYVQILDVPSEVKEPENLAERATAENSQKDN